MSYARFSSDDWTSDVYVYAGSDWITIVRDRHWVWGVELPPEVEFAGHSIDAWLERHRKVMSMFDSRQYGHWADLPDPGKDYFNHATPGECADNLERLASLGFHVPAGVVDDLREEQKEMDS